MFALETIKEDMRKMKESQFFVKYFLPPATWYFYNEARQDENKMNEMMEQFAEIVSVSLSVSSASIFIVGSAKLGYRLSPRKDDKLFRPFGNSSDFDIAILSNRMFEYFWYQLRERQQTSAKIFFTDQYRCLASSIFRGFLNSFHIEVIDGVKTEWIQMFADTTKKLQDNLGISHKISYRIYRHWEDFEQYQTNGIKTIKRIGGL
ncbi:MAG: hypothetical protein LBK06_07915 [Planctomycetaceae bacterium]|jgi:hypothetical protein|nr:hypothetical protein [Planctomycetaceae bacterium]